MQGGNVNKTFSRWSGAALAAVLVLGIAACGDDDDDNAAASSAAEEPSATQAPATEAPATEAPATEAPAASGEAPAGGEGITLAINPWTGSAVNANVAKVVLE